MQDPSWDDGVPSPNQHTRVMVEWLNGLTFQLTNEPNVPTREDSARHSSMIDLVFANKSVTNASILSGILINTEIGNLSNHHTLCFTIRCPQEEIPHITDASLNWKHADEDN